MRFPHIGEQICGQLSNNYLTECKKVCVTWNIFINNQKLLWTRIIEAHINPALKSWQDFLKTSDVETLFEIASTVLNYYNENQFINKDFNPLHFAAINGDIKIVKRLIEKEMHQKSIEDV